MARRQAEARAVAIAAEPTGRALDSKRAIVDAGTYLFARYGYGETGVQQIVDRASLTKGSFYYAFDSKQDLLRYIQRDFIEACHVALVEALESDPEPDEALERVIDSFISIVGSRRDQLTIFFQESRYLREPFFADVRKRRDEFEQTFVDVLLQGEAAGVFREVPAKIVSFGIIGMCAWTYHWLRPESGSIHEISQAYADVVLNGLFEPRARPRRKRAR
jgi:TetR/AcrR family transcriptional regulator, cholesterol catabolism regulator